MPGGSVGIPLTAAAVADLCRDGAATGGRVRLWEPSPEEEPVDFLAVVAGEFAVTPVVLTARRGLASVLVKAGLGAARERGLQVTPRCPVFRAYMQRHPETHDLLSAEGRTLVGI